MNKNQKKFIFIIENIEEIFLEISNLKQFNKEKKDFLKVKYSNKYFLPPIEDVFVNSSFNIFDDSLALLGIIKIKSNFNQNNFEFLLNPEVISLLKEYFLLKTGKSNGENYLLILDENNNPDFAIREIHNFGIYIFAGRPDLIHYEYNSSGLSIDNLENFKNRLEKFAKLLELLVNEVYNSHKLETNNNFQIEYKFVANKIRNEKQIIGNKKREIPEALRRFYARSSE